MIGEKWISFILLAPAAALLPKRFIPSKSYQTGRRMGIFSPSESSATRKQDYLHRENVSDSVLGDSSL
jgi:hypothetical protein